MSRLAKNPPDSLSIERVRGWSFLRMIDERKTSEIFSFSFDRRDTKFFIEGRFLDFSISEEQLLIRNLLSSKEFKRGWNDSILLGINYV